MRRRKKLWSYHLQYMYGFLKKLNLCICEDSTTYTNKWRRRKIIPSQVMCNLSHVAALRVLCQSRILQLIDYIENS